jgi:hypothetical protein
LLLVRKGRMASKAITEVVRQNSLGWGLPHRFCYRTDIGGASPTLQPAQIHRDFVIAAR